MSSTEEERRPGGQSSETGAAITTAELLTTPQQLSGDALDLPLVIGGAFSSPYSLKMRAVLRYRRIPHRWVLRNSRWDDLPAPPVPVIPVLAWPDGAGGYRDVMVDSSPQITRLEDEHHGRSVVPADPAVAFLDFLLEDFADEWVTKAMYHFRWAYDRDIEKAGLLLPLDQNLQLPDDAHAAAHDFVIERAGRPPGLGRLDANQRSDHRGFVSECARHPPGPSRPA